MTATPAIALVLATIAIGVPVGVLYLLRARRPRLVTLHLALALAGTALVAWLVVAAPSVPAGPPGALPLALLALASAAGWGARRLARRIGRRAELVLGMHVAAGVAGFLVLLAWVRAARIG